MKKSFLFSLQSKLLVLMVTVLLASFWLYSSIADNHLLVALDKQLHIQLSLVGQKAMGQFPFNRLSQYQKLDYQTSIYQNDLRQLQAFVKEQQLDKLVVINNNQRTAIDSLGSEPGQPFGFGRNTSDRKNIMLFRTKAGIWQKAVVMQLDNGGQLYLYAGQQMLNAIEQARSKRYLTLSFSLLLAFVLSWLLVTLLSKRFAQLVHAFQRLQSGQRDVHVPSRGRDEIAYLSTAFNQMAHELQSKADHVQRQHEQRLSEMKILSAGVAHEIRNPLGAVSGLVELLERKPELAQSPDSVDLLKRISSEIDRMNLIIIDMMAYAKQPELIPVPTDINDLLTTIVQSLPTIQLNLVQPLPQLHVDPAGIRSVLRNLIVNAQEATNATGTVQVGTRLYKNRLHIYVADDGPGLSEEMKHKLFMPFYSTKSRGSGLGLAIAKNIALAHQGKLQFRSSSKGTLFTLALPLTLEV